MNSLLCMYSFRVVSAYYGLAWYIMVLPIFLGKLTYDTPFCIAALTLLVNLVDSLKELINNTPSFFFEVFNR